MEAQFGTLTLMASRKNCRAARFVTGNYVFEPGSMAGILGQLKWESLEKRRKDSTVRSELRYTESAHGEHIL